jgi:hypothetical protein
MNVAEGTKRMQLLGLVMAAAPAIMWVLYNLYEIQPIATHSGFGGFEYHFNFRLFAATVVLMVPGAILWASGWIVAGFAKEAIAKETIGKEPK